MTDLVTIGFKADTSGLTQAQTQLEKTATSGKKLDSASAANQKSLGNLGKKAGQAGIQIQQFTGQVTTGTNSLVALSQQAADLGIVLGAPLLGVFASLGATALLMASDTAEAASALSELEDIAETVGKTLEQAADGSDVFSESIQRLANRSESLARVQIAQTISELNKQITTSARGIKEAIEDFDGIRADVGVVSVLQELGLQLEDMPRLFGDISAEVDTLGSGGVLKLRALTERIGLLSESLGISTEQATSLQVAIDDFSNDQSATGIARLRNEIESLSDAVGPSNEKVTKLASSMLEFFESSRTGVDRINLLREALTDLDSAMEESDQNSAKSIESARNLNASLQAQIIALTSGAEAAELFAAGQAAVANGTEALLPQQIELIKQKHELKRAQEEALKSAKEEAKALAEAKKESEAADRAYQSIIDRLDPMAAAQRRYNEELAILTAAGNAEAIALLNEELAKLSESTEKIQDSGISSLLDDVDNLTSGFSNLGNTIVDAFGDAAAQLNNFAGRMNEITKLREELTKKQQSGTLTLEEQQQATEALNKLNQDMYATQLGAIGGVLGASKTMFKEQSKEREVLHRLEMGFMVAEMALAAERAVINASAAIASAATAPFPIGFAAAASMTALMAGVLGAAGVMFSSSSGGYDVGAVQESQGTGTEFGDSTAKADSLVRLQERFEDIQIDQLGELRGIRDAMDGLSNGIAQLAMDIVGTGRIGNYSGDLSGSQKVSLGDIPLLGGAFSGLLDGLLGGAIGDVLDSVLGGLFGKTKKKLVDEGLLFQAQEIGELISGGIIDATYFATIETTKKKLFGLSKKTSVNDETSALDDAFSDQIGLIFNYLADSVTGAIDLLGIEAERSIEDFVINIGKISFKDMTGEEIQAELEAVFSQQGDLIAKYMWPQVTEYQKLGEGALETLMRVAQEFAVFNDAIDNLGLSLGELEPGQVIAASQALMDLMGGLEEFTESVGAYYDEFFTEQEKMDDLGRSIAEVFADLNIAMPESRGEFRMLVESLDLTTEAGRALFATLMEIAPSFAEFLDGMEDLELEEAARKAREAEAAEKARQDALNSAMRELERAVQVEKDRARAIVDAAREVHEAETDRINGLIDALNEEKAVREQALSDATSMLQASFSVEKSLIQAASNARIEALNGEIATLNELKATAESEYQERIAFAEAASTVVNAAYSAEIDSINAASALRIEALNEEIAAINALKGLSTEEYEARLAAAGAATQAVRASYNAEINAINEASSERISALNEEIATLNILKDASTDEYQARVAAAEAATQAVMRAYNAELESIRSANTARIESLNNEIDSINNLITANDTLNESRLRALSEAEQAVNESLSAEIAAINEAKNARVAALNEELGYYRTISGELSSLADSLRSQSGIAGNTDVAAALSLARRGDFSLAQSLSVPAMSAGDFGSAADMRFASVVQGNQLNEIADLASNRASAAERQIQAIERSIEQENANAAQQIDRLQSQVDLLLGVDNSIMTLATAMERYTQAQAALSEAGYAAQQEAYAQQIALLDAQIEESQAQAQQQEARLTEQVNALLGIDDSVLSLRDATAQYMATQSAINEDGYNSLIASYDEQIALIEQQIAQDAADTKQQVSALAQQMNVLLGIDDSVLSVADAVAQYAIAQAAIDKAGYDAQQVSFDEQIALIEQQIIDEQAAAVEQVSLLTEQMNALLGIDNSVLSVEDAIAYYADAQAAIDEEGYRELIASYDEQIAALNEQIAQEEANTQAQLDALDEQLNTLLGIDTTILGLQEAIERYQFAKADLDALDYDSKLAHYEAMQATADAILEQAEKAYNDEIDRLDAIVDKAQSQIDKLNGINDSVMSVEDAIMNLTVALIGAGNGKGPDDDIIIVTPVPVDTWATMGGDTGGTQTISNEVVEVLESIARHTATSANNSTRARIEGQQVRIVSQ